MKSYKKKGYFTAWIYNDASRNKSHRVYYNDLDISTGDLIRDGVTVGNVLYRDRNMTSIDRRNNYMW